MSQQVSLERMVADWMVDETAGGLPEHVFDQIVTTTSRRRPLPRWLAVLREPEMRAQSQVAVGVPRRPLILIGVALLLAVAIAIGVGAATLLRPQPSTDVWPGFRGDASRAGLGVTGPVGNPVIRWTFPATGSVSSDIAVAGDLVLAPSDDGLLHALGIEDGRERWSFAGAAPMKGPLAIGDRAWVADGAGVVHAMSLPDGKSLWDSTSPYLAPSDLTVMDDRLYLGTGDGSVVAMDAASGREVWRQTVGTSPIHPPAAANGTIVVASDAGDAKALDPATGAVRWTTHVSDAGIGTPVIAGDLVFIGAGADSAGSRLVALDLASGTERWHDDRFLAAPAIAGDVAYATGPAGLVSAVDRATGAVRWTGSLDGNLRAPAVAGDAVYVSADRLHQVVALDQATGRRAVARRHRRGEPVLHRGGAGPRLRRHLDRHRLRDRRRRRGADGQGDPVGGRRSPHGRAVGQPGTVGRGGPPAAAHEAPVDRRFGRGRLHPLGPRAGARREAVGRGGLQGLVRDLRSGRDLSSRAGARPATRAASSTSRGPTATRTAWWRSRRTARSSCSTPATAASRRSAPTASSGWPGATSATIPVTSPTRSASRSTATGTSRSSMTCVA